jgi:AAA+ ATPase superfamily predicted ATPase
MYSYFMATILSKSIIGRNAEKQLLLKALRSDDAEFIAVYGRRRVGKTFLVRSFFENERCIFFQTTGIKNGPLNQQLSAFKVEIERTFYANQKGIRLQNPIDWMDAFLMLTTAIQMADGHQKVVVFMDEFPWMATPKSSLLQALDYYWNRFWVNNPRIKLVICGSAASWIIDNILNNKAGLHNRVTMRMHLEPFNLAETQLFLEYKKIRFTPEQILDLYMCIGGIPYYLKFLEKSLSVIQNINTLCFQKNSPLADEFQNLYSSLFDHSEIHKNIIQIIASKRYGISRSDIEKQIRQKGGRITQHLKELEASGFISAFMPAQRKRGIYYKIIDEYTMFYLHWINPHSETRLLKEIDDQYWNSITQTSSWKSWAGYAFESVCYKHLRQIRKALKIPTASVAQTWRHLPTKSNKQGAQIDLVFDRPDGTINLCEIKYRKAPYSIDKAYAHELNTKKDVYQTVTNTKKHIIFSLITATKVKPSLYSEDLIASAVQLGDFFY